MGAPSWAVPGAQVVCVKIGRWESLGGIDHGVGPTFGQVLTIRSVWAGPDHIGESHSFLEFPEFAGRCYLVNYFRPVVNDTTEAELFRARRTPHPDPPPEGAREKVGA